MFRKFVKYLIIALAVLAFAAAMYYLWPLFALGVAFILALLALWAVVQFGLTVLAWAFSNESWSESWEFVMSIWTAH